MKRPLLIAFTALLTGAALFAGAYFVSQKLCARRMASSTDDLEWLRVEFRLSDADITRVRELHEGYMPKCAEMCARIADKRREIEQALAATNNTAAVATKLAELGAIRAQCQSQMLAHFAEVSRAMPAEQGRRYLAEMQRLTLGAHEQIENSMSAPDAHAHGHQ